MKSVIVILLSILASGNAFAFPDLSSNLEKHYSANEFDNSVIYDFAQNIDLSKSSLFPNNDFKLKLSKEEITTGVVSIISEQILSNVLPKDWSMNILYKLEEDSSSFLAKEVGLNIKISF